jgi:hypothetical protein
MDVCVCFYIVENMSNEYCVTYYCHLREMLRSNQSASCTTLAACAAKPASAVEISYITFSPAEKHETRPIFIAHAGGYYKMYSDLYSFQQIISKSLAP